MDNKYTMLSQQAWDELSRADMTPGAAAAYLMCEHTPRTFPDIMRQLCATEDIRNTLINALCAYEPDAKRDSVARKVRKWMNGENAPDDRETLFRVSFALGLSIEAADRLLATLVESGIHLRNPREVVYAYCLREGKSYEAALALFERLPPLPPEDKRKDTSTKIIRDALDEVRDDEAFIAFYAAHTAHFSTMHYTAYTHFERFLKQLINPDGPNTLPAAGRYSIERVVEEYMRMRVPLDRRTAKLSASLRIIRRFWPNETIVLGMQARKEDVSRKVLLLLYVITEGIGDDAAYDELDEAYIEPAAMLEEHCWRINLMLEECGLGRLDPRAPFDWLVLYALCHAEDEAMSERMEAVIAALFGGTEVQA